MLMPMIALIIFAGATNGGVNADLRFSDMAACEAAAAKISAQVRYADPVCVEVR